MGAVVVEMQAVIEVAAFDAESPRPWPIAPLPPGAWMALNAGCTDEEVGLFVATLAHQLDVTPPAGRDEVVATLLAEKFLIVAGGLRLLDTATGTAVEPGCCDGLEDWREWVQVLTGGSPWLGHNPSPEIELTGSDMRVWQDGRPDGHHGQQAAIKVVAPRFMRPDLLRNVQRDLGGFLAALEAWTTRIGLGETGPALVEAVDRSFTITAPLGLLTDLSSCKPRRRPKLGAQ